MQVFIYNEPAQGAILKLRKYAEAHPFSMDDMLDLMNDAVPAAGSRPEYSCQIGDYKIVFSYEQHPLGMMRHLSVSVGRPGQYPMVEAVSLLMKDLGFSLTLDDVREKGTESGLLVHMDEGEGIFNILEKADQ